MSRFSISVVFSPELGSEFMSEVINFLDLVHPENLSLQKFLDKETLLIEGYKQEYNIGIEVSTEEDGSVELTVFNAPEDSFETILDDITDVFYEELEIQGYQVVARGTVSQEIKVDDEIDTRHLN